MKKTRDGVKVKRNLWWKVLIGRSVFIRNGEGEDSSCGRLDYAQQENETRAGGLISF